MRRSDLEKSVVFENNHYVAVNKPAGVAVLDDRSGEPGMLKLMRTINPYLQVCHRLDKDTSGVLLFSKSPDAYKHAALQFQERTVEKVYHALVHGQADFQEHIEDASIIIHDHHVTLGKSGKRSTTIFDTIEVYRDYTLVSCKPLTGRMHQIRVHLQGLGHSIVADSLYGGHPFFLSSVKRKFNLGKYEEERPLLGRLALHAVSLKWLDLDGNTLKAAAPYPKDITATLKQLGRQ